MKPKVIRTEADNEAALQHIYALMENDPEPSSPEGEELELFSLLVERYEEEHYPMDLPSPLEAIQFRMEQQGLKNKDLIPYIGSASKVSEVLSGQRGLSLTMIRNLVEGLGIPAEVLIGEAGGQGKRTGGERQSAAAVSPVGQLKPKPCNRNSTQRRPPSAVPLRRTGKAAKAQRRQGKFQ